MKQIIKNYSFNATARTITFTDFTTISLERVLLITNVTDNAVIYIFNTPSRGGSVAGNVLTLEFDTSSMSNSDKLQITYDCASDDPQYDAPQTSLASRLDAFNDRVTAWPKTGNYVHLTASGQILGGPGRILGFFVNATSGGTIRFSNATTATTPYLGGAITPAVGWHQYPFTLTTAGYVTITGTIDVTFSVLSEPTVNS